MSVNSRKLKILDAPNSQWASRNSKITLDAATGEPPVEYQGQVLTSTVSGGQTIEFALKSNVFKTTAIEIPLIFSSETIVSLSVGEDDVGQLTLPGSGQSPAVVQWIRQDITRWAQATKISTLKLQFARPAPEDTITFLLDDRFPSLQPRVLQSWQRSCTLPAILFFGLSALCVLGLAVLVPVHLNFLSKPLRFYGVLGGASIWLCGALGLIDKTKIPINATLRKLYQRLSGKTLKLVLLSLFLILVLVYTGVGFAVNGMRQRHKYSELILAASQGDLKHRPEAARQAFVLLPWRREAQILFEQVAYHERNPQDMTRFRGIIATFATNEEVKNAVRRASEHGPSYYLSPNAGVISNPVVWYSNLVLETVSEDDTAEKKEKAFEEALAFLATQTSPEAVIQRTSLRYSLVSFQSWLAQGRNDPEKAAELEKTAVVLIGELEALLSHHKSDRAVTSSITYQTACDTLGIYYIRLCASGKPASYQLALTWFQKEIHERVQSVAQVGDYPWQRPPEKLSLCYILSPECGQSGKGKGIGESIVHHFDKCYRQSHNLDEKAIAPDADLKNLLLRMYPDYAQLATWRKGTVLDNEKELKHRVQTDLLEKGWRY